MKIRPGWRSLAFQGVALTISMCFVLPLVFMLSGSLRQAGLPPPRGVEWLPWPLAWENYGRLFTLLPVTRYLANSLLVTLAGTGLTLLSAALAGYGMAQMPRRRRRGLLVLSIALLMAPVTGLWLSRFVLFSWLGWIDSYSALLAPALMGSSPLFVLLFYWAFRRVPREQIDAAYLDGADVLQAWRLVALPQARPALVTVGALAFLQYWNDFLQPLLYLRSQRLYTLAVGLQQLQQMDRTNWPLLLAGAVVMTLPALFIFWLAQRTIMRQAVE